MAVVTGDILRFTMIQELLGETCINVDFRRYVDVGGSGNTYEELLSEYVTDFTNEVGVIQSVLLNYNLCRVENLSNGIEFAEQSITDSGLWTGEVLPSAVAVTVKLNRETKITRNGSKRIAGIGETAVIGNDVQYGASTIAQVETFFGDDIDIGDGTTVNDALLEPYIIGRTLNASGVYELDLNKQNPVTSATLNLKISSQNSRKPQKGI